MQGCCDNCIKYLLFGFNLIFAISGLILICIGGIILANVNKWGSLDPVHDITSPQIVIIVVGCFIFLIASLGCCGAIKEIKCKLIMFAVLLLITFFVQLVIGIYAIAVFSKERVADEIGKRFKEVKHDDKVEETVNNMQVYFVCCGVNGPTDYAEIGLQIPDSCCNNNACSMDYHNVFTEGCRGPVTEYIDWAGKMVGGFSMAFSFVEIIGALLSLRLAQQIKKRSVRR